MEKDSAMAYFDPQLLFGMAAVLSSLSTLVWAFRRKG